MSSGVHDLAGLSDAALDDLLAACSDERRRRRILRDAPAEAAVLAQDFELAAAVGVPTPWAELLAVSDRIGPGQRVVWLDGEVWRNISGAWLPVSATPEAYPLGWSLEVLPPVTRMWAAGGTYSVGELVEFRGEVWRCLIGHTNADPGHTPDLTPALWVRQGV